MAGPRHMADASKQNYVAVCALADKLFSRIREVVASQLVPTTLKVRPAMERRCKPISLTCKIADCIEQVLRAVPVERWFVHTVCSRLRLTSRFVRRR